MSARPQSPAETPLTGEFDEPSRAVWLELVDKVLKGSGFDRLVTHTSDGLAIEPLYTRPQAPRGLNPRPRMRGPWDVRQRHAEPDAQLANAAILEDLAGGVSSLLLQIEAPGQAGLPYGRSGLARALEGVGLRACTVALDARENTMDAAGSLIEIWRAAGIGENERHGAFNLDPLGVLAATGTLYHSPERSCAIAAKFARDCRTMSGVQALLADGRPYHEAGASSWASLAPAA